MKSAVKILSFFMTAVVIVSVFSLEVGAANSKSSFSDYAGKGFLRKTETEICSCDGAEEISCWEGSGRAVTSVDPNGKVGSCYKAEWTQAGDVTFFYTKDIGTIDCAPSSGKVTLKMWIYVNDMSKLRADHSDLYGYDYSKSGTVYLRAMTDNDRYSFALNQTIKENGWQEIEFTFDHDNGVNSGFEIHRVNGFWINARALSAGLVIKIDNLRVCHYTNDGYTPDNRGIPSGARIVSHCDYDGLEKDVVTEWFDSDFSTSVKLFGRSSYHSYVSGEDDQRMFWGCNGDTVYSDSDYLCFWLYVDKVENLKYWFIELNQTQDNGYEIQLNDALVDIKFNTVTPLVNNTWTMVQLPLKYFRGIDQFRLNHLRMAVTPQLGKQANIYVDNISIASESQVDKFNSEYDISELIKSAVSSNDQDSEQPEYDPPVDDVPSQDENLPSDTGASAPEDTGNTQSADTSASENSEDNTETVSSEESTEAHTGTAVKPVSSGGQKKKILLSVMIVLITVIILGGGAVAVIIVMRKRNAAILNSASADEKDDKTETNSDDAQ